MDVDLTLDEVVVLIARTDLSLKGVAPGLHRALRKLSKHGRAQADPTGRPAQWIRIAREALTDLETATTQEDVRRAHGRLRRLLMDPDRTS